jgi:hypothetical protein
MLNSTNETKLYDEDYYGEMFMLTDINWISLILIFSNYILFIFILKKKCISIIIKSVIFIGIGGNMLVILVIIKNKILRSTSNLFLISLSIADLMVASFVMPIYLLNQILGYFPWGYLLCDVWVCFKKILIK